MRKTFLYLLLISSTTGFAQKVGKPDAYAKTITADDLKRHLYIVAGPEMQGRDARKGVATHCIGGGQGVEQAIER